MTYGRLSVWSGFLKHLVIIERPVAQFGQNVLEILSQIDIQAPTGLHDRCERGHFRTHLPYGLVHPVHPVNPVSTLASKKPQKFW